MSIVGMELASFERRGEMKKLGTMAVIFAMALGAVLLLPARPLPAEEKMDMGKMAMGKADAGAMDMEKMISSAKSAADHEALAAEYESEAKTAKAKAAEHRKMAESYKRLGGGLIGKQHLDEHCERLAKSYDRAAMEYEMLAKAHRGMAKSAK